MFRRKRQKVIILVIVTVAIFVLLIGLARLRLSPIIQEMATTRVSNEASFAINRSIIRQIEEGNIAYDRIVLLEKDLQGNISAIKTNMAQVNLMKTTVLSMVDEEVLEISVSEIGIPFGNLLLPEFFSGKGPTIPVHIMSVSSSDAEFISSFSEAGINQTLHKIFLSVEVTMSVLTPMGTQTVTTKSQMLVAETVIVGAVPQTYWKVDQSH